MARKVFGDVPDCRETPGLARFVVSHRLHAIVARPKHRDFGGFRCEPEFPKPWPLHSCVTVYCSN